MSLSQIATEYVLVYCTSVGLTAIGEPTLAKTPETIGSPKSSDGRPPMPVRMVFIFVFMAFGKWFISFLVSSSISYPRLSLKSC